MNETPHSKRPCDHEGLNLSEDKKSRRVQRYRTIFPNSYL
jgi:hypothetical protein